MSDRFPPTRPVLASVVAASLIFPAAGAKAYWRDGVWVEDAPPAYSDTPPPPPAAPPPDYVAPPPMAAAPPGYGAPPPVEEPAPPPAGYGAPPQATAYGTTCYAGAYVCPLHQPGPVGANCACPGIGAPSYGTIR